MTVYIILGVVLYFLIAGIIGGLLGKYITDEDAELLVIFLSGIWPITLPFCILGKIYFLGMGIIKKTTTTNHEDQR